MVLVALSPVASRPASAVDADAAVMRPDVAYTTIDGHDLLLDVYLPPSAGTSRPAVVLIHGGAWRRGSKSDFAVEGRRLALMGWVAFSVDYRLTSPAALPAEIDDVAAAVRWVRAHAGEYGVDPARIGALGASAGGHLAAMLATVGEGPLDRDARIQAAVSWSGPMNLTRLAAPNGAPDLTTRLLECAPAACPEQWARASPIDQVDRSDAPLLLINSSAELIPLDQAQEMADRLQAARVEHRLDVLAGRRHGQDFGGQEWKPTVAFLRRFLDPAGVGTDPSSAGPDRAVWVAIGVGAVAGLVAAGLIVARRRDRRRPPAPTDAYQER